MKDFIHSMRFKVFLVLALLLLGIMLYSASTGGFSTAPSSILGAVTTPIQSLTSKIGGLFSGNDSEKALKAEIERLQKENRELTDQIIDYNNIKTQNEQYKLYLGIKEEHPDFEFEPAQVIGSDPNEHFYGFTINKGTLKGIKPKDTVITADGLVGYVKEAGPTYAKIITILDPSANAGVYSSQTRDKGVVGGTYELAREGLTKLSYLPRESTVAVGDLIVTSGLMGMYPEGLVVGTVKEIKHEKQGVSMYGVIVPAAQIQKLREVFVIKNFDGKGEAE